jgi:hypothetical protein
LLADRISMHGMDAAEGKRVGKPTLGRKAFFVNPRVLRRAQKVLRVSTEAEAVRVSLERVVEMRKFWRFMVRTRRSLKPGSIDRG